MYKTRILCLTLIFLATKVTAQQTPNAAPGFRADAVYDFNGIDNVSLFNGSLSMAVPIGIDYPVAGFLHGLGLHYSSSLWDTYTYSSPCPTPSECPVEFQPKSTHDAGLGWRLNLPQLIAPGGWNQTTAWIYVDATGGEHTFYDKLHINDDEDSGDSGTAQLVQYTRDGSYLRFKRPSQGSGTVTIELPNGHIHSFLQSGDDWILTRMEDRFGNGVVITRGSDGGGNLTWTLDDGLRERVITFEDQGPAFPRQRYLVSKIELPAFDTDTLATYTFTYATKTVNRPGAHTHPDPTDRTIDVRVLQKINLPDGSAYTMGSVANPAYRSEGYLSQLRLPTLGYLEWDWENYAFPKMRSLPPNQEEDEAVEPFNSNFGVSKRRQKGIGGGVLGEWTYTRAFSPGVLSENPLPEKLTVTVKRPLGDKSEHYFSVYPARAAIGHPAPQWDTKWSEYSLPYTRSEADPEDANRFLSSKIFDCNENGNACELVRSEYVGYELDDDTQLNDKTGRLFNKNRRLRSRRTVDHYTDFDGEPATNEKVETFSDFDGLGHYRSTSASSDFGPDRSSLTNFNPTVGTYPGTFDQMSKNTPWILGLYDSKSMSEGGQTAKQEACFDTATGFLERSRILKQTNGARSSDDIVQEFTRDNAGQVTAQFWYGGDTTSVGTGALCNLTLGNSSFRVSNEYQSGVLKSSRYTYHDGTVDSAGSEGPLTFYNVRNTEIDTNTGLVETTHGPNGLTTSYAYDNLGRLRAIKPSEASGAAYTKIWYGIAENTSTTARAEVRELPNGSLNNGDALTEKHTRWDGLGRVTRDRVRLPSSATSDFADKFHWYDAEGRERGVSTWAGSTTTASTDFDAFGRPQTIYPPDADVNDDAHRIDIAYEGFRKIRRTVAVGTGQDEDGNVTESQVSRTEEYDAYGRLIAVTEPSGPGGSDVRTTYEYDLADRLTKVTMPVAGGQQIRTWTYDQRGFLTSECHPEKGGSNGGGCVTYSGYNPMGKATQVTDGPFTRKYNYDRAGSRLTTIRDGSNRLLKSFSYGRSSVAGNRANGQLIQATNVQRPVLPQGEREQHIVEDFQYGGVGGARDYRKVSWIRQCEPGETSPDCQDDGFCDEESFEHSESFDPTGKLTQIDYPTCVTADGGCGDDLHPRTVTYGYEAGSGFLSTIPSWADFTYHNNMTVAEVEHTNGITDVIGRDPHFMGRPGSMHVESSTGNLLWESGTFRYDGAGNLIEMVGSDFTDRFVYDGVSRLVRSQQWVRRAPNTPAAIFADDFESGDISAWNTPHETFPADAYTEQLFGYDVPGNLHFVTTDSRPQNHDISSLTNRITDAASYDTAGNLVQFTAEDGPTTTYTFDPLNRLVKRAQGDYFSHYLYTADDERILRFSSDGLHWSLRDFGGRLLREFRPQADRIQPIRDHVYRGSGLLATIGVDGSGNLTQVRHQSLDHLGSPRYITDGSGVFVSEHKYYPYGEEATRSTQDDLPLKFTGHERDFNELGEGDDLDYMHARFCDPRLGRFLSLDPVRGSPGKPQSWNRYAYVGGNPMAYVDPDGRAAWGLVAKFAKWLWKGGDTASTFAGIAEDAATVANPHAPPTSRALAAASLATEVFSPISAKEAGAGAEILAGQNLTGTLRKVLRGKAGFADEGLPIILDENLAGRGVAQALRDKGLNVRDIREIFGQGNVRDSDILSVAETLDARVLTLDRGRQMDGGFFGRAIPADARATSPESLFRILSEELQ